MIISTSVSSDKEGIHPVWERPGYAKPGTVGRISTGRLIFIRRVTKWSAHAVSLPEGHEGEDIRFETGRMLALSPFLGIELVDISSLSPLNQRFIQACSVGDTRVRYLEHYPTGDIVEVTEAQADAFGAEVGPIRVKKASPRPETIDPEVAFDNPDRPDQPVRGPSRQAAGRSPAAVDPGTDDPALPKRRRTIFDLAKQGLPFERLVVAVATELKIDPKTAKWHVGQMLKSGHLVTRVGA